MNYHPSIINYQDWRLGQEEVATNFGQGKDVVLLMPTGGGKSACYQVPALLEEGLTVVFSPLKALMKDQASKLQHLQDQVQVWNSDTSFEEVNYLETSIEKVKLLYVAPERIKDPLFQSLVTPRVRRIVVDEAHCLLKWGNDFRPEFTNIKPWIETLDYIPTIMACSASLSPEGTEEVIKTLGMKTPAHFHHGYNRPNITIDKIEMEGDGVTFRTQQVVVQGLKNNPDFLPAIVYAGTVKETINMNQILQQEGFSSEAYYGNLETEKRHQIYEDYKEGKIDVVVATSAFGMGIDLSNIRSVWHYRWPTSFEDWYQEIGRAGRDNKPAHAILCAYKGDLNRVKRMLDPQSQEGIKYLWDLYNQEGCLRQMILDFFQDSRDTKTDLKVRCCSNCEPVDWLDTIEQLKKPIKIKTPPKKVQSETKALPDTPGFFWFGKDGTIANPEHQNQDAFESLKQWRKERAQNRPAYTVCQDKSLQAALEQKPTDAQQLLSLPGIGPSFVQKHGDSFLKILHSL